MEKEMATHSNILAWRIPGTEEPGGLPSMGSHRVRHDWSDLAAATTAAGTVLGISWLLSNLIFIMPLYSPKMNETVVCVGPGLVWGRQFQRVTDNWNTLQSENGDNRRQQRFSNLSLQQNLPEGWCEQIASLPLCTSPKVLISWSLG